MTASPSILSRELAHGRRDDLERRAVAHRPVRPDARPRRGRLGSHGLLGAPTSAT